MSAAVGGLADGGGDGWNEGKSLKDRSDKKGSKERALE